MPIYIELANLIIQKTAIKEKYAGGIDQFKKDYNLLNTSKAYFKEDNELFVIYKMNADEFNIEKLIKRGLSFNEQKQFSDDFTIKPRYYRYLWNVNWLQDNGVYVWHHRACTKQIKKAQELANGTMDELIQLHESGFDVYVISSSNTV